MTEKKDDMKLDQKDLEAVSGGEAAFDYYDNPVRCNCGSADFKCLGWDSNRHGYNFRCTSCGEEKFLYR